MTPRRDRAIGVKNGKRNLMVIQVMDTQAHPLVMAIPRFIQLGVPLPPFAVIEPSALRTAKETSLGLFGAL
jgi:hypothetical protein